MLGASKELSNVPGQPQWTPVNSIDSTYDLLVYMYTGLNKLQHVSEMTHVILCL